MKKIIFTLVAGAMAMSMNAQSITISKIDEALANDYASGCEIDIDNDGLKELIFGGSPNWNSISSVIINSDGDEVMVDSRAAWVLKWNGSDYTATQFSDYGVFGIRGSVIPCDFNGDGNVDIYIASGGDEYTLNGIYLNDGNGNFVKDDTFKVLDEEGNAIVDEETGDLRWLPRDIDIADFNCDGLPDIVSCGWWLSANSVNAMAGVLINNGDGTYTVTNRYLMGIEDDELAYAFALCTVKAFDLNNDGYADFMVQGNVDNSGEVDTEGRTFMAFLNLGVDGPGEFYDLGLADGVARQYGNGNFNVVDFNNDGVPDIFVTGESPVSDDWDFKGVLLKGKISGTDVSYSDDQSFAARMTDIRPLNACDVGTRAIDYNGDGYYDLFLLGWSTAMLDGSDDTQGGFFLPGSASGLISWQRMPGASEQGAFFLDNGVVGGLNFAFTGYHGDTTYFPDGENRAMVFTNNPWTVADRPNAPTDPEVNVNGNTVTLSWTPASSSMKNVTYEYYLKTNGKIYNGCTSFIGGDNDGVRKVLREGNAYMNTKLTLTLPDGDYEWGVQTVNAAEKGSVFATGETFRVGEGTVDGIDITTVEEPVAEGALYNVAGQKVTEDYKGIVIKNGVKVLNK